MADASLFWMFPWPTDRSVVGPAVDAVPREASDKECSLTPIPMQLGILAVAVAVAAGTSARPSRAQSPASESAVRQFELKVRPLLAAQCVQCHGAAKQEGGLRLDTRAAMLAGGESGPAIVPGKPAESLLVEAVEYQSLEMPPGGQLQDAQIKALAAWIGGGAVWPEHGEPLRAAAAEVSPEDRAWWAFQPLRDPPVPAGDAAHPIDRFVLQKLAGARFIAGAPRAAGGSGAPPLLRLAGRASRAERA